MREIGDARVWRKNGKERIYIETGIKGVTVYLDEKENGDWAEHIWADYFPDKKYGADAISVFFERIGNEASFKKLIQKIEGGEK